MPSGATASRLSGLEPVVGERTPVAIVGAGPAGRSLGQLLRRHGVHAVILEARDRDYVELGSGPGARADHPGIPAASAAVAVIEAEKIDTPRTNSRPGRSGQKAGQAWRHP